MRRSSMCVRWLQHDATPFFSDPKGLTSALNDAVWLCRVLPKLFEYKLAPLIRLYHRRQLRTGDGRLAHKLLHKLQVGGFASYYY